MSDNSTRRKHADDDINPAGGNPIFGANAERRGNDSDNVGIIAAVSETLEAKLDRQLADMRRDLESMDSVFRCRMVTMREEIDRSVAAAASATATLTTALEASEKRMTDNLSVTGARLSEHVRGMVQTVAANTPNDARIAEIAKRASWCWPMLVRAMPSRVRC